MIKVNSFKNDTQVEIKGTAEEVENELMYLIEVLLIEKVSIPSDIFSSIYGGYFLTGFGNEFRTLCKIVLNNPNLKVDNLTEVFSKLNKEGEENESN